MSQRDGNTGCTPDLMGIRKLRRMSTDVINTKGDYFDQLQDELKIIRYVQAGMMTVIAELQSHKSGEDTEDDQGENQESSSQMSAAECRYDPQPKSLREVFALIDVAQQQKCAALQAHAFHNRSGATSDETTGEGNSAENLVSQERKGNLASPQHCTDRNGAHSGDGNDKYYTGDDDIETNNIVQLENCGNFIATNNEKDKH